MYFKDYEDNFTVVIRRSELNRSSQVAAALRKASCRRISCSTSSTLSPSSLLLMNGSCAVSHASATTASWANWWTSNTEERERKVKITHTLLTSNRKNLFSMPVLKPQFQNQNQKPAYISFLHTCVYFKSFNICVHVYTYTAVGFPSACPTSPIGHVP